MTGTIQMWHLAQFVCFVSCDHLNKYFFVNGCHLFFLKFNSDFKYFFLNMPPKDVVEVLHVPNYSGSIFT